MKGYIHLFKSKDGSYNDHDKILAINPEEIINWINCNMDSYLCYDEDEEEISIDFDARERFYHDLVNKIFVKNNINTDNKNQNENYSKIIDKNVEWFSQNLDQYIEKRHSLSGTSISLNKEKFKDFIKSIEIQNDFMENPYIDWDNETVSLGDVRRWLMKNADNYIGETGLKPRIFTDMRAALLYNF